MYTDRKVLYILSLSALAALLTVLLLPEAVSGRWAAAVLLAASATAAQLLLKKRSIASIHSRQVLLIMGVFGALYTMGYYVSGIFFGFYRSGFHLSFADFSRFVLPISIIIVASEWLRSVILAQKRPVADVACYLACVIGQVLIRSSIHNVHTFHQFMDLVGLSLFPATVANLLYHYLSKRYGALPNMVYRLLTTVFFYSIPYKSAISDSLLAFIDLILPVVIWAFVDALYEKKRHYALVRKSKLGTALGVLAVAIMAAVIMLVSNQFRFGALVIATESMTGELNKGDVAIFERYEDQVIQPGQIIVYENSDSMVVHRVVDIHYINGSNRYFTKGDCNEANDTGFVTDSRVVGLVKLKAPYIGFPTLWLRSLFS